MVPIVEGADGTFSVTLFGKEASVRRDRLEETRKALQDAGQYSFVTTPTHLAEVRADRALEKRLFADAMTGVLRSWIELAQERLSGTAVKCYISPGNDDLPDVDPLLADSGNLVNPENRVVELPGGHEMITLGYTNPTPWKSPREVTEDKLGTMIEALASKVQNMSAAVFNLHVPPIDTELDRAPAVSSDFTYVKEGLGIKFIHAGSSAVRTAIENHGPLLGLHGHIHESKGFAKLGRTLCLNPGSEYADGILRGAIVNLDGGKVKEFLLTSG